MRQPVGAIRQGIAVGGTTRHKLPNPTPVFVVYETAFVDTDGTLQFRPDFYDRDPEIWRKLQRVPQEEQFVAQADHRLPPTRFYRLARSFAGRSGTQANRVSH